MLMETTKMLFWLGVIFVIVATIQTFQIRSLQQTIGTQNQITLKTAPGQNVILNQIDLTGWTEEEIMNYEMHGVIPARIGNTGAAAPSMVGGC